MSKRNEEDEEGFSISLGEYDTERDAALAYDRAAILVYGDDAETNFPPEESEHVVFAPEIMQRINAAKRGQRLH